MIASRWAELGGARSNSVMVVKFPPEPIVSPVYKATDDQERQYLADADRPAEVARLKKIVA